MEQETRKMLPEVRKYVESVEAATAAMRAAEGQARTKYPERYHYSDKGRRQAAAFDEELSKAYTAHREAQTAAWRALTASGDPLVKWIAENCAEYTEQAEAVLTALPATVEELDDLAEREDWCPVWDRFRQGAIEAGVVPGVTPPSPARRAVFERIDQEGCCHMGPRSQRRIGEALDALITEALTAAANAAEARTQEVPA